MWVLLAISVVLLVLGFIFGFESNGARWTDVLLNWTYIVFALTLLIVVVFGAVIAFKNNPKSIIKGLIGLVILAVVCGVVYLLAPGKPAVGMIDQPSAGTLKLTDTVLILTYIAAAAAVVAIIVGEIVTSVRNKK